MGEVLLARWQFAITSTYHFLFVPMTLGLTILLAVMETRYLQTGNELYKRQTQFWGKLFLVNFAMGVVTGIVQEFHFGMNWSEYSRFMGDIFGAPLAMEALTAFFLESTFIGIWIFGWDRISPRLHCLSIWAVAIGSNISAFWILVANSFMQAPVGYAIQNGRAEMTDFSALLTNPYVWNQFPHVLLAGLATAGIFIASVSAWSLLRGKDRVFFRSSMQLALTVVLAAGLLVSGSGHMQAQFVGKAQPMKLAAAEALWQTEKGAPFSFFSLVDEEKQTNSMEIGVPGALSFLATNDFQAEVRGLKDLQKEYEGKYGPGNYIPPVTIIFWSFRLMVAAGGWMILIAAVGLWLLRKDQLEAKPLVLRALVWSAPVPFIANSAGWFMAEIGRQPWIVFGLQKVSQAVSPNVGPVSLWISLTGFTVIYAVLAAIALRIGAKFIVAGPPEAGGDRPETPVKEATLWN